MNRYIIGACFALAGCVYVPVTMRTEGGNGGACEVDAGTDAALSDATACASCSQALFGEPPGIVHICDSASDAWMFLQSRACESCAECQLNVCEGYAASNDCAACVAATNPEAVTACGFN